MNSGMKTFCRIAGALVVLGLLTAAGAASEVHGHGRPDNAADLRHNQVTEAKNAIASEDAIASPFVNFASRSRSSRSKAIQDSDVDQSAVPARSFQRRDDPLNSDEIDQLRETAIEPEKRMKLYVQFARARLVKLEQMLADPKVTDRGHQTHNLLQEFLTVYDELNDNLDNFLDRKVDLRKALKAVIEGDTEFQAKLRAFKSDPRASKEDAAEYNFILSTATEAVDNGAEDHRKLLTEQQEIWKNKKK